MVTADEHIAGRAAFSTRKFRPSVDKQVLENDPILWNRARMLIRNITRRYVNYAHPMDYFEIDLHDLWYLFIEIAKITPVNEATADRLVNQVIYARELGQLSRIVMPHKGESSEKELKEEKQSVQVEIAITSTSARIWTDLPFFVTDLRTVWANTMTKMSRIERENLAGFTARLAALGVCDPQLTSCALILFREALETPRRLLESHTAMATDNANEIPLSDFLPAVLAWLWYGSYKIFSLCARNHFSFEEDHINDNEEWIAVGKLLADSEGQQQLGFNMLRWQFWKSRLEEISRNTGNEEVAEQGRKCAHIMEAWEKDTGGRERDREIAREAFFGERD